MISVTVTIKRGDKAKTFELKSVGKSKKGTFEYFSPVGENTDLPEWGKLPVSIKPIKAKK